MVCFESNLADVSIDSWWIDSGKTVHICNPMQDMLQSRPPTDAERSVYMGNGIKVDVEAIRVCKLRLKSGHTLNLVDTFCVPSIRRNLISISRLHKFGYSFKFENKGFSIYYDSNVIGTGTMVNNLYQLDLNASHVYNVHSLHGNKLGTKRRMDCENSSMLWHRRLGHISRERLERLVREGILHSLDFSDFKVCTDCIKGKQTRIRKKCATRSVRL